MHLAFVLEPTRDLDSTLAAYCAVGFSFLVRPDDETVLLEASGSLYADLMLEASAFEDRGGAGPVFRVDSVDQFFLSHREADWVCPPTDVLASRHAALPVGSRRLRVFDTTAKVAWSRWFR